MALRILDLPVDVFLAIITHLPVHDTLNLRKTCKGFYQLTQLHSIWHHHLNVNVIEKNIPIPGLGQQRLGLLSARELERCTFNALRLRSNWISPSPTATRKFQILQNDPSSRVISVHFVPGERHWLLTVIMTRESQPVGRNFKLQCWDLESSPPVCVAHRSSQNSNFGHAYNIGPSESPAIVAVQSPYIELLSIDTTVKNPADAFITIAHFPEQTNRLHVLSGTLLLTRDPGNNRIYIWDSRYPQSQVELINPDRLQPEMPLAALLDDNGMIVLVTPITLEVYRTPQFPSPIAKDSKQLRPIAGSKWPWRIDSVALSRHLMSNFQNNSSLINILIRYGSLFPWPVNLLHHYELSPNAAFGQYGDTNLGVLPYIFPPVLRQTMGSPIRIFSPSDMVMGPFGTALWIDSHTEGYFGHSDRGQRLAGKFSPSLNSEETTGLELVDQVASTAATSVYEISENDSWVRLALDEIEGKIALGGVDGQISVLEFA